MRGVNKHIWLWLTIGMMSFHQTGLVFAQASQSPSYYIDETFIGPGGTIDSSSSNFNLQGSVGDTGIGESSSANYNLLAGFTTDAEPTLAFQVNTASVDLGNVSPSDPGTGTATFSVGTYNSSNGYTVQTAGASPTNEDGYNIPALTTQTASAPGTEQFGINLVANTSPEIFGSNPVQVPDATFSFGSVSTFYDTTNVYRYNEFDQVAESSQSTGETDYTVSYLMNVAQFTGAGSYTMNHIIIATGNF